MKQDNTLQAWEDATIMIAKEETKKRPNMKKRKGTRRDKKQHGRNTMEWRRSWTRALCR